ncbi:hypothetical protein D3C85_423870 [compost metagenome]
MAVLVPQRLEGAFDPDDGAALVHRAMLQPRRRPGLHRLADGLQHQMPVFMIDVVRRLAAHLLEGPAQQLLDGRRDILARPVHLHTGDDVADVLRQQAIAPLVAPRPGQHPLLLGHVLEDAEHGDDPAGLVDLGLGVGQHPPLLAVRPDDLQLGQIALAVLDPALDHVGQLLAIALDIEVQGAVQIGVEALPLDAVDAIDLVGPFDDAGVALQPPVADARHLLDQPQRLQTLVADARRLDAGDDVLGHPGQQLELAQLPLARHRQAVVMQDAQGPDRQAVRSAQGRGGEEPQVGLPRDDRVVPDARVQGRVGDHQHRAASHLHHQGRQAVFARRPRRAQAGVGADDGLGRRQQGHHRRPAVEHGRRQIDQPMERPGRGVERLDALGGE